MKRRNVLLVLFLAVLVLASGCSSNVSKDSMQSSAEDMSTGETKEITIEASNWRFDQSSTPIKQGDLVRLGVKGAEGLHGLTIPDLGVSTGPLGPGEEEIIEFLASESGTFDYFCNVPCGAGHREMVGQLVIQ